MSDLWARVIDNPEDVFAVLSAVVLFSLATLAFIGTYRLRRGLVGLPGHRMAGILVIVIGAHAVAQALTILQTLLIAYDRVATEDIRVYVVLCAELIEVGALVGAFWAVRRLVRSSPSGDRGDRAPHYDGETTPVADNEEGHSGSP